MKIQITATFHGDPSAFALAVREAVCGFEPGADLRVRVLHADASRKFQVIETEGADELRELIPCLIEHVRNEFSVSEADRQSEALDLGQAAELGLLGQELAGELSAVLADLREGDTFRSYRIEGRWRNFLVRDRGTSAGS